MIPAPICQSATPYPLLAHVPPPPEPDTDVPPGVPPVAPDEVDLPPREEPEKIDEPETPPGERAAAAEGRRSGGGSPA